MFSKIDLTCLPVLLMGQLIDFLKHVDAAQEKKYLSVSSSVLFVRTCYQ